MKNDSNIGNVLFGKTRRSVLGLLFTRPDESFYLRQISRLAGVGIGPVQREMAQLSTAGLVAREQKGRQVFYSANRSSPVFPELQGLVVKTAGLADLLREAIEPLRPRIHVALLFGSFAKGEQTVESDVDLMIIGEASFRELAQALDAAQRRLGREINPTVYPRREFQRKLKAGHHFLSQVLAGPKVFLIGDEDELAGMAGQRVAPGAHSKSR
jgi:predicted nucleotidyltransferase